MTPAALRRLAILPVLCVSVVGCGRVERFLDEQPGPVIEGVRMGPRMECRADDFYQCSHLVEVATPRLDETLPGHDDVADVVVFREPVGVTRSGTYRYVVFELDDQVTVVVGVYCGVGGCSAHEATP